MVVEAKFFYNGNFILIQCKESDIMKDIIGKYISKAKLDINKIYFLYGGNIINNELSVKQLTSGNSINILVSEVDEENATKIKEKKELEKSNVIICSICKDICKLKNPLK